MHYKLTGFLCWGMWPEFIASGTVQWQLACLEYWKAKPKPNLGAWWKFEQAVSHKALNPNKISLHTADAELVRCARVRSDQI